MRKLLRCKKTKAFLANDGTWTKDIENARSLVGDAAPEEARAQFPSREVELYYSFEQERESAFDFALALR